MGNKETYEALQATVMSGDYEAARDYVSDDFVLHEPEILPYGGEYRGPQGFFDLVQRIGSSFGIEVIQARYTEAGDDLLVCEFVFRFTSKRTGKHLEMAAVDLYRFGQDGKLVGGNIYFKDPGALAAMA